MNFAIQQGVKASRATVFYFRHNDVQHLAELIECHCEPHAKVGTEWPWRHPTDTRPQKAGKSKPASRFLIVEGLYINYGDLCPLPEMVSTRGAIGLANSLPCCQIELKKKHKVRLFIDDTCAFGVLGAHGRGTVEHYGCDLDDVDMIAASLEYACAAYGGFCTGTHYIIDHQRLSGLGYCFSASLPPLQAAAGLRAILLLKEDKQLVSSLRHQCLAVSRALEQHRDVVSVSGLAISPIKHLRFARRRQHRPELEVECLEKVTQYVSPPHCPPPLTLPLGAREGLLPHTGPLPGQAGTQETPALDPARGDGEPHTGGDCQLGAGHRRLLRPSARGDCLLGPGSHLATVGLTCLGISNLGRCAGRNKAIPSLECGVGLTGWPALVSGILLPSGHPLNWPLAVM